MMMQVKKAIYLLYIMTILVGSKVTAQSLFPFFTSGSSGDEFTIGVVSNPQPDPVTFSDKGVRLTSSKATQKNFVTLKNLNFNTDKGFKVSFEFEMTKPLTTGFFGGDGISLILYDGAVTNPQIGSFGSGLGYSYAIGSQSKTEVGFTGGFLGFLLDYFGDARRRGTDPIGSRNGHTGDFLNQESKSYFTIRGPIDASKNNQRGTPVLFSRSTIAQNGRAIQLDLDKSSPTYGQFKEYVDILPYTSNLQNKDNEFRKIYIDFMPGQIGSTHVNYLTVKLESDASTITLLENYVLYEGDPIAYKEIRYPTPSNYTTPSADVTNTILLKKPSSLKMAFAASTGGAYQEHYVRNISVSLPYAAITNNDLRQDLCYSCGVSSIVIFANDYGYNSNLYNPQNPPVESNEFLDYDTFSFMLYNEVSGNYTKTPNPYKHHIDGEGTFEYINSTKDKNGYVTFTPQPGVDYIPEATIYYNIKNKKSNTGTDISTEEYRSNTSKITLRFNAQKRKKYLFINGDHRGI